MSFKAMVAVEAGRLEMQDFDLVPPERDQMLVKLDVTSVCASDPKILHGKNAYARFPLVLGHELSGRVAQIGPEAADVYALNEGDRVTVEPFITCGHCKWCRTPNHYHKCTPPKCYGLTMTTEHPPHVFGGYAEYMYFVAGSRVHRVAEEVPALASSLSSVVGNGVRWIKTCGEMGFGQSLCISGAGPQGLATLIAAREFGVGPIAMLGLERDSARFELAREFGVDFTVNVEEDNPLEAVPDLLGGPPDVVVEASGVPAAIRTALNLVAPAGRVVSMGFSGGKETSLNFDALALKGVTLVTDVAQAGNVEDAMKIINSGKYALEKINNHRYTLDELDRALNETVEPPPGFIKGAVVYG